MGGSARTVSRFLGARRDPPGRDPGGRHIFLDFFDVLSEFAAQARNPQVVAIQERFRNPPGTAVLGRRGVGRRAVAAALAGAGVVLATDPADADVHVLVAAEELKPEERAQLRAAAEASIGTMVVLNKADLCGATRGGPLAYAERRAAQFAVSVGRPVVPMIAHLATVALDCADLAALRTLSATPADVTSTDAFVGPGHPLPVELRRRLLDRLDRFGLAHAVRAVAAGATGATVESQLRALSQVDRVAERLTALTAPVRYRRMCGAVSELCAFAAQSGDDRLGAFLTGDEVVISVMAAAVDVVTAAGFTLDSGGWDGEADAYLGRAVRWAAYARGPVGVMHERCAKDIARGSLRLSA